MAAISSRSQGVNILSVGVIWKWYQMNDIPLYSGLNEEFILLDIWSSVDKNHKTLRAFEMIKYDDNDTYKKTLYEGLAVFYIDAVSW